MITIPEIKQRTQIGLRLGEEGMSDLERLTRLAGKEKPTQLVKSIIRQLATITEPFDVRNLTLNPLPK